MPTAVLDLIAEPQNAFLTRREVIFAWLAAFVLVPLVTLTLAGPRLFDRPFWADETLSWLIASDPSFDHGMGALAGGVDTNAPLIHVLFRGVGDVFGHTPMTYRTTCATFTSLALVGLYLILRRSFGVAPAIIGCLAFWSVPIVIAHQTEARFYGAYVAAAIWTCYAVEVRRHRQTVANASGLALVAVALCGLHYFGIVVLSGVLIVEAFHRGAGFQPVTSTDVPRGSRVENPCHVDFAFAPLLARLFPTFAGIAMTLCLWPLLRTQREALADVGGTWLADAFLTNLSTTLQVLLPASLFATLTLIAIIAIVIAGRARAASALTIAARSPLAGLAVFPVVMLAFDRLAQPVLVPRYFMPFLPAVVLVVAAFTVTLSRRLQTAIAAVLVAFVGGELLRVRAALNDPQPHSGLAVVRSVDHSPSGLILVDWRGHLLPIWAARPDLRGRLAFLDDRRITDPDLDQSIPFERRMVVIMQRFYGFPNRIEPGRAERIDRFTLVTEFPESVDARFAGWTRVRTGELRFEMSRDRVTAASD